MQPQQDPSQATGAGPSGRSRHTGRRVAVTAAAATVLALAATALVGSDRPAAAATLVPFDDCEQLRTWSQDALRPAVGPYGLDGPVHLMEGGDGMERSVGAVAADALTAAGSAAGADTGSAVGPGATGTNVQEAGVDEPDLVKTADGLLVTTVGDELVLVDVASGEPRLLSRVGVPALARADVPWGPASTGAAVLPVPEPGAAEPGLVPPDQAPLPLVLDQPGPRSEPAPTAGTAELLLVGDAVVVLGTSWLADDQPTSDVGSVSGAARTPAGIMPWTPSGRTLTTVTVVDVSDRAAPTVRSTTELEGGYVSARESSGAVRLVTSSTPVLPWVLPSADLDEDAARQRNLEVLAGADASVFLPHRVVRDDDGRVTTRTPLLDCADVAHPSESSGAGTVTVTTLDVTADDPVVDTTAVLTDGELVYASTDRLYVATTRGGWTWRSGDDDEVTTALHGFDVSAADATTYVASGEVDGWLLGRWALSAREGMLRVATTRGERWAGGGPSAQPRTDSAVTVLDERNGRLVPVGEVTGLGVGEQIRAVRWFEDLAVVVTFRQTDPLYLVDLADPASPTVRGELKVPGYSAYLHPLGDGMLMGVGQDATADGRTTGAQVATYDVSDLADPRQVDVLVERDTWSEVENDSRTFTYLPDRRVALVPVSGERGPSVRAVEVAGDGSLREVGEHSPDDPGSWLVRAVPVAADRVVALTQTDRGPSLTVLALDALAEGSSLRLS